MQLEVKNILQKYTKNGFSSLIFGPSFKVSSSSFSEFLGNLVRESSSFFENFDLLNKSSSSPS